MSFFKNFKNSFIRSAKNNLPLAIYSIIIALLVWFIISMTFYPSVPKTLNNVKLDLDLKSSAATENGLSIISCDVDTVSVKIKGSRTQVGNLTSDSLVAYLDTENINSTGQKTVSIKVRSNDTLSYEVESITPSTATVVFDKYDTRQFQISPKLPNISIESGKIIDSEAVSCEPSSFNITGPSAQLDKIAKCYAVSEKSDTLSASYNVPNEKIELYAEDGSIIDQSMLTFDKASFIINVPVLTQKKVDLTVTLQPQSIPENFDTDWLMKRLSLSTSEITIASGNTQSELPSTLEIGSIKLSDISLDFSTSFDVSKVLDAAGLKNISNIGNVGVSFDSSGLAVKEFTISNENIHLRNKPSNNYDYTVLSNSLNITVVGPEDVLSELTSNDFVAVANLLGTDNTNASDSDIPQFSTDVVISCSDHNNVWAITKSKINIQKTPKQEETSQSQATAN